MSDVLEVTVMVAEVRGKKFDLQRCNLRKLNDVELNSTRLKSQIGLQLLKT
jgi:hypothetical protein